MPSSKRLYDIYYLVLLAMMQLWRSPASHVAVLLDVSALSSTLIFYVPQTANKHTNTHTHTEKMTSANLNQMSVEKIKTKRLATANRSRVIIRIIIHFVDQGSGRGQLYKIFPQHVVW